MDPTTVATQTPIAVPTLTATATLILKKLVTRAMLEMVPTPVTVPILAMVLARVPEVAQALVQVAVLALAQLLDPALAMAQLAQRPTRVQARRRLQQRP